MKSGGISIFVAELLTAFLPHGLRAEEGRPTIDLFGSAFVLMHSGVDAPDVAWRGTTAPPDPLAIIDRVRGA